MHSFFFFNDTATTEIYTLSLHDALPISPDRQRKPGPAAAARRRGPPGARGARQRGDSMTVRAHQWRSEEHTSELQSHVNLVCRLLLEKKKQNIHNADSIDLIYSHYMLLS